MYTHIFEIIRLTKLYLEVQDGAVIWDAFVPPCYAVLNVALSGLSLCTMREFTRQTAIKDMELKIELGTHP